MQQPQKTNKKEKKSRRDPAQGRAKREEKPSRLRSGTSEEMHVKTIYDTQAEPPQNENQQKTKKAKEKAPPQTSGRQKDGRTGVLVDASFIVASDVA